MIIHEKTHDTFAVMFTANRIKYFYVIQEADGLINMLLGNILSAVGRMSVGR